MQTHVEKSKSLTQWLNLRDTVMTEALLASVMLIIGIRIFQGGAPIAANALVNIGGHGWASGLIVLGFLKWAVLIHGQLTGNSYRLRSYVCLFASFVWVSIVVGVVTSDSRDLSASGMYIFFTLSSFFAAIVLVTRADAKSSSAKDVQLRKYNEDESELHVSGALPKSLTSTFKDSQSS